MANFPAGFEDLSWATLDTAVALTADARTAFAGASQDLLDGTYSLLPQMLAVNLFNISITAGGTLQFGVSWSPDNTNWKNLTTNIPVKVLDALHEDTTRSEVYVVAVKARYFRLDYLAVAQAATVSAQWASIFGSTYQA